MDLEANPKSLGSIDELTSAWRVAWLLLKCRGIGFRKYLNFLPMKHDVLLDSLIKEWFDHVEEDSEQSWLVDNMDLPEPEWEATVHECDDGSHLLETTVSQMFESESSHIIDHGDSSYLSLHLPGDHLEEDVGGGVEVLQQHLVRVPLSQAEDVYPPAVLVSHI